MTLALILLLVLVAPIVLPAIVTAPTVRLARRRRERLAARAQVGQLGEHRCSTIVEAHCVECGAEDYRFSERIVLDEEAFAEFSAEMENPRPPNAALRRLMRGGS